MHGAQVFVSHNVALELDPVHASEYGCSSLRCCEIAPAILSDELRLARLAYWQSMRSCPKLYQSEPSMSLLSSSRLSRSRRLCLHLRLGKRGWLVHAGACWCMLVHAGACWCCLRLGATQVKHYELDDSLTKPGEWRTNHVLQARRFYAEPAARQFIELIRPALSTDAALRCSSGNCQSDVEAGFVY